MLMVYVLKFRTLFSFCSNKNVGYQDWKKMLARKANREDSDQTASSEAV